MKTRLTLLLVLAALPLACGDDSDAGDDASCGEAKCDDLGDFGKELAMMNDPIAVWLRANLDKDGNFAVPYLDMLKGIAKQQGCADTSLDSYVISDALVVDGKDPFPRIVNTVCSDDRTKADMAFFALSFADESGIDVDTRTIEMFAWDATTFEYRFYKAEPVEGSKDKVAVRLAPSECAECHRQPSYIKGAPMPMTPIMNELSAPWQHWFAEPQSFDHIVSDATKNAPNYKLLAGDGNPLRKSASRLEQTIRSAFQQRVATARLRVRRNPANLDEAMGLLRPLFCDEQLTYITEDGKSGLLAASAVIDEGMNSVYFSIKGTGWPWEWWNDKVLRLEPPGAPDAIRMMPIRGAAPVTYEKQLMSTRALTPDQVMRIRALDWANPVLSDFRCNLFLNALDRVKAGGVAIPAGAKNVDIFPALVDFILTVHKGDFDIGGTDLPAEITLKSGDATKVIAFAKADTATLQAVANAVAGNSLASATCGTDGSGFCLATNDQLGAMIEARYKAVEGGTRDPLNALRLEKACVAQDKYPNKPHLGTLDCALVDDSGGDTTTGDTTGGETTGGGTDTTGGETGGTGVGNCCTQRDAEKGCDVPAIEMCVCAQDDLCCNSAWDNVCVDEVVSFGCAPSCA
jgi:hypothetical protein